MNYGTIKPCDIANGTGVRTSLFVSGCTHHCKECFQPMTWDFQYGDPFTEETVQWILELLKPDYIAGLSLLGGEPFEPKNQPEVWKLVKRVRETYPDKNIWCYSGFTYDRDLTKGGCAYTEYTDRLLENIDVLVDGEFVLEQKDITLKFRGSRNQRLIDLKQSTPEQVVLLQI